MSDQWINVTDKLPKYEKRILATDGKEVTQSMRHYKGEFIKNINYIDPCKITHWMSLPEPINKS